MNYWREKERERQIDVKAKPQTTNGSNITACSTSSECRHPVVLVSQSRTKNGFAEGDGEATKSTMDPNQRKPQFAGPSF